MRGELSGQDGLFSYVSLEQRVPAEHPLRMIKARADAALSELAPLFARMYSSTGRPSIPPERLLKSQLLIALFSVRSDRQFCEQLEWNLLFRWFLEMTLDEAGFDASTFSKNRARLLEHEVARRFEIPAAMVPESQYCPHDLRHPLRLTGINPTLHLNR